MATDPKAADAGSANEKRPVDIFFEDKNPLEFAGEIKPLQELERFDRDESRTDEIMPEIERIGDDIDDDEPEDDPYVRSRAFELERAATWHEEDPDREVPITADLESFDEAEQRMREQASEFQKIARLRREHAQAKSLNERPARAISEFESSPRKAPKHRRRWERSDVEIMDAVRRGNIVRGMLGRALPLVGFGVLIAAVAAFIVFPLVLPGGRWGGTLVDRIGDSKRTYFTMDLDRSGDVLTGWFWLARSPGAPHQPDAEIGVPYSLQPVYTGEPIPVVGRFSRTGLHLTLYGASRDPAGPRVEFEGTFSSPAAASGTAVNSDQVRSEWRLRKD